MPWPSGISPISRQTLRRRLGTSISDVSEMGRSHGATLKLPEHWQVASNTFHVDKYIPRAGEPLSSLRPRRFCNRPAHALGTISRISRHRHTGRLQRDGSRQTLNYFVHWKVLSRRPGRAYGEWLTERNSKPSPMLRPISKPTLAHAICRTSD